jgi:hypothetical protein
MMLYLFIYLSFAIIKNVNIRKQQKECVEARQTGIAVPPFDKMPGVIEICSRRRAAVNCTGSGADEQAAPVKVSQSVNNWRQSPLLAYLQPQFDNTSGRRCRAGGRPGILLGSAVAFGVFVALTLSLWMAASRAPTDLIQLPTQQLPESPGQVDVRAERTPAERIAVGANSTVLLLSMLFMAIATCAAVASTFYLYRWRRVLSTDRRFMVPEELIASLNGFNKEIGRLSTRIYDVGNEQSSSVQAIALNSKNTAKSVSDLLETALLLQRALDDKDNEIRRLRQGYDIELFRRFIGRFVRVKQTIEDYRSADNFSSEACDQINRLLDDALDECGVEQFAPKIGADYRNAEGVADSPRIVQTNDTLQSFSIAGVLGTGYRFRENTREIIIPARVSIFMTSQQGG